MMSAKFGNSKYQLPIIKQQPGAYFERGKYFGMRQVNAGSIARRLVGIETKSCASFQLDLSTAEFSNPQLGSLQVDQYRCRPVIRFFERANVGDQLYLVGLFAVAHVDSERIGPGTKQLFNHLWRVARWT